MSKESYYTESACNIATSILLAPECGKKRDPGNKVGNTVQY